MNRDQKTKPQRRTTRLPDYDYTQPGAYFITICVKDRQCRFGKVIGEKMVFSKEGEIVRTVWEDLPSHYPHIKLDEFVIMPNHVHGIIWLLEENGTPVGAGHYPERKELFVGARHASPLQHSRGFKSGSLGSIVASFKSTATKRINEAHNTPGSPFWQRNYYDHVIRDEEDLFQHHKYIQENVFKWVMDEYHSPG